MFEVENFGRGDWPTELKDLKLTTMAAAKISSSGASTFHSQAGSVACCRNDLYCKLKKMLLMER